MSTVVAGGSGSVTIAPGGSVSIASNGGFWQTTETPTVGSVRSTVHGPTAHTRVFGPFPLGATLSIVNQTVGVLNYVDYEVGTATNGTILVGAAQTFTLGDQGTLAVSNPAGYWQAVVTPAIGSPSTAVYGPGAGNMTFGPFPGGATVVVTNQSGATLVTSAVLVSGGTVVTANAIVANRLQIPTSSQTGVALFTCQRQHTATGQGAVSTMQFTDLHWFMDTASGTIQTSLASTYTFRKWVEYPQGTFTPVLYSGVQTATLNTTTRTITSDVLSINIPAGATWWEHTMNLTGVAAAHVELPAAASVIGALDAKYTAANNNTPAHQAAGQASTFMFGSVYITGTVTGPAAAKSVAIFSGDSIPWGAGDISGVGALQSSGPWSRALDLAGIGHFKFAVSSMQAQHMATIISSASATFAPLLALIQATNCIPIITTGCNDLSLGSRTQAQLLADYATIQGALTGKVWGLATLTPRTTSTDAYATEVNQTVKTDGTWSLLTGVNAAIRAKPAGFSFTPEYADDVMTARDSGIWKSSPTIGFQPTTDGTHPTTLMAAYLATNLALNLP